jgi:hypothetical protein
VTPRHRAAVHRAQGALTYGCVVKSIVGFIAGACLLGIVGDVVGLSNSDLASAAPSPRPVKIIVGVPLTYAASDKEGYGGRVAYGAPLTRRELAEFGPPNPDGISCISLTCFGIAAVGGPTYPVVSFNGRRSWRNAGHWFSVPAADGAAFASTMKAFSPSVVIAWTPGQNDVYVTNTAGRLWYSTWPNGQVTAVSGSKGGYVMTMRVMSQMPNRAMNLYRSTDRGRIWRLTS